MEFPVAETASKAPATFHGFGKVYPSCSLNLYRRLVCVFFSFSNHSNSNNSQIIAVKY